MDYKMLTKFGLLKAGLRFGDGHTFPIFNADSHYYTNVDLIESKLQSLYDSAPVVYGDVRDGTFYFCDPRAGVKNEISHADTHTAKLMFIEEIKKAEPCKHEVSMSQAYGGPLVIHSNDNRGTRIRITCCKCGVEVKPTWESAE